MPEKKKNSYNVNKLNFDTLIILAIAVSVMFAVAIYSYHPNDPSMSNIILSKMKLRFTICLEGLEATLQIGLLHIQALLL